MPLVEFNISIPWNINRRT